MARPSRASRPTRSLRDISDNDDDSDFDDNDDEFPDLATLAQRRMKRLEGAGAGAGAGARGARAKECTPEPANPQKSPTKPTASVRRRKLVPVANNALLRAWTPDITGEANKLPSGVGKQKKEPRPLKVEVRTRTTRTETSLKVPSRQRSGSGTWEEDVSEQEEVTIIEEVSIVNGGGEDDDDDDDDDVFQSAESNASNFEDEDRDDGSSDDDLDAFFSRTSQREQLPSRDERLLPERKRPTNHDRQEEVKTGKTQERPIGRTNRKPSGQIQKGVVPTEKDITDPFSRLRLDDIPVLHPEHEKEIPRRTVTPPPDSPPADKTAKPAGLVSPKKLPRIPKTPHRESSDMFWSRDFVDDWNDEHSPRKQLFPDAASKAPKGPSKPMAMTSSPKKTKKKSDPAGVKPISAREAKKLFEKEKHEMAQKFLEELDTVITNGQLSELAASTGGIKIHWSNKLNTTAGRANWKRETVKTTSKHPDPVTATTVTRHRHHASIELAEKVIDDPHRLLNVVAHEFCHLANFMISGVTTNPHGREFKAWAARCSAAFGESRGIEVTTKHSYDIDFKYVWTCTACAMEYKRHSKSINPERHRCGSCKSELRQTKPTPRGGRGGNCKEDGEGGVVKKPREPSEYQKFMKEHMKIIREENPKSPQKDIMRLVASRWAQNRGSSQTSQKGEGLENVTKTLESIDLTET